MYRDIAFSILILTVVLVPTVGAEEPAPRWIVVTAPAFEDVVTPLCEFRRGEGMDVVLVRTSDVLSVEQLTAGVGGPLEERVHRLCTEAAGASYVLLVGAVAGPDSSTVVPPLDGTVGRMKGQPSDNGYGCPEGGLMPTVAVGRLPARTEAQARDMVRKTLAFERNRTPGIWPDRLTLIVGNPGGASPLQMRFAEWFVRTAAATRLDQLDPLWTCKATIHATGSPFCVPDDRLEQVSLDYLQAGQVFSLYLGHSGPSGLWSAGTGFMDRGSWARMEVPRDPGIFFTCGCYGCQLRGRDGQGYGLVAMRNPNGPVGVIGAHGESYAAMGQLALDGMMACLHADDRPERLGDYWLAVAAGLARGPMDPATFWLYDQADGTGGRVPLDTQRLEHLEMWMLLGDPALRIPVQAPEILLTAQGTFAAGRELVVSGSLPKRFGQATVRLTLERPVGSAPIGLEPIPADSIEAAELMMANHRRANAVVLESREVLAAEGRFECTLKPPTPLLWPRLTLRAIASTETDTAIGVLPLPVR